MSMQFRRLIYAVFSLGIKCLWSTLSQLLLNCTNQFESNLRQEEGLSSAEWFWGNSFYIEYFLLQAQIAFLQGERKGQENLKKDLVRRIKMLEYALKQERYIDLVMSTWWGNSEDRYCCLCVWPRWEKFIIYTISSQIVK